MKADEYMDNEYDDVECVMIGHSGAVQHKAPLRIKENKFRHSKLVLTGRASTESTKAYFDTSSCSAMSSRCNMRKCKVREFSCERNMSLCDNCIESGKI